MTDISLIVSFMTEDVEIQGLNGGIRKKFTSLSRSPVIYTNIYDPILFKWDFGDGNPIYETTDRVTYHTYDRPGTYLIKHQACNFCTCSDWGMCFQSISVVSPKFNWPTIAAAGFFGLLILKKECEDRKTKKECEDESVCQWIEREKKCIKKCREGYRLEKTRIDETKRPPKFICEPIKKISKLSKK